MKKSVVLAVVAAIAMLCAAHPAFAAKATYHSGDVRALRAFAAHFGLDADTSSPERMTYGKPGGFVEWTNTPTRRVRALRLGGRRVIGKLDAAPFPTLRELYCSKSGVTEFDLSQNVHLEKLVCSNNTIKKIDLSGNRKMRVVEARYCGLKQITFAKMSKIAKLYLAHNSLTKLDLYDCLCLEELDCMYNAIASLDTSENKKLKVLYWDGM